MAGNLKGQGGIKGLALMHGEKVAVALVGLVALWLIYKTTTLPHLKEEYQAAKLQTEIQQTSAAVRDATWPESGSEQASEVHSYKPIGEKLEMTVSSDLYKNKDSQGLDIPVFASTTLRLDPQLVNAKGVVATGGSGLFAILDEAVRKERERVRAREEAERAKRDADKQEKEKKAGEEPGAGRRNRGPENDPQSALVDKEHPKRKPVQSGLIAKGVSRQGDERVEQVSWAIVLAKVPIREQLKLYQDAFEKAKLGFDPARDFPRYKGYVVQRAEVIPGADLDWKPVPVYDGNRKSMTTGKPLSLGIIHQQIMDQLYEKAHEWAGMSPDVIDARFADYVLTFPLPPLVARDWGAEATHPDIPLIADTPPLEEESPPAQAAPTTPENPMPTDENSAFAGTGPPGAVPGAGGFAGGGPSPPRGGFGMGGGKFGEGGGMGFRPGAGGRGFDEGGGRGGRPAGGNSGFTPGQTRTSLPKGVDFLLLRFFDFTVQPGKNYKYRVQLVLEDPNGAMPDNVLAPEVLDRLRQESQAARAKNPNLARPNIRRINVWSDPSPTVGIPLPGSVKLVNVKPASTERINDEPTTELLVESFDFDDKHNAIQASKKKEFRRGSVANMVEDARYLGDGWTDEWKGFKFETGMTVLDIDGGKKIPNVKDYTSPGRVLLMGPAGELYIHHELDDKPAIDYYMLIFESKAVDGAEGPGRPGGPKGGAARGGRER